jgi:hypothetical protein
MHGARLFSNATDFESVTEIDESGHLHHDEHLGSAPKRPVGRAGGPRKWCFRKYTTKNSDALNQNLKKIHLTFFK